MATPMPPPIPPGTDIHASRAPQIYAATIITFLLAVLAVALRFWARRLLKARVWLDDWIIVLALVFATGQLIATIIWCHQGYGKHLEVLDPNTFLADFFKNLFAGEILYTLLIVTVKFSILAFYWRLFGRSVKIPVWILGGITAAWGIAVILVSVFQCTPVSGFWNRLTVPPPQCIVNDYAFFVGIAVPNIITDVAILSLPVPCIWRLHRDGAQKIALAGIFALGGFVTIISVVRLTTLINVDLASPDVDWNFAYVGVWTMTESNIAIVSACLPSLRPVMSLILTGSPVPTGYGLSGGSSKQYGPGKLLKRSQPSDGSRSFGGVVSETDSQRNFVPLQEESNTFARHKSTFSTTAASVGQLGTHDTETRGPGDVELGKTDNKHINVRNDVNVDWSNGGNK